MTPDELGKLAQKPGLANKLRPELLAPARQIAGTIGFIVTQVRIDGYLGFCIVARYLNEKRLTKHAWICLLRLGHYLVATIELPLILRCSPPRGRDDRLCRFRERQRGRPAVARWFLLLLPR